MLVGHHIYDFVWSTYTKNPFTIFEKLVRNYSLRSNIEQFCQILYNIELSESTICVAVDYILTKQARNIKRELRSRVLKQEIVWTFLSITSFVIANLITSFLIANLITSFLIAYLITSFLIAYLFTSFVIAQIGWN